MKQVFHSQELIKYLKKGELYRSNLNREDVVKLIDKNEKEIINGTFQFDIKSNEEYFFIEDITQKLILRKLNDNVKRIYKDEQANRKFIIQQVKTLLSETAPFWVIKTDVKSFYESIDKDRIFRKLKNDAMLSYFSISLIKKVLEHPVFSNKSGLPRGINISSTLSEIYMRKFDNWVQRSQGVYYYARFVDDIIIFVSTERDANELFKSINIKLLEICNLEINTLKTELILGASFKHEKKTKRFGKDTIEYLGYQFYVEPKLSRKDKRLVKISIADKKVKKIKTRLVKSYVDFVMNRDFNLLMKRIKFLTGNYEISEGFDDSILKAGIFYNYTHLNDYKVLEDLNDFHRKMLYSKSGSFGGKLNSTLESNQRILLKKYCFTAGHKQKTYNSFSYLEMGEIIKCW